MFRVLCLVALIVAASASGKVTVLDGSNFDEIVNGDRHVLVKFFAPWCGHCKNMAAGYEELAGAYGRFSKDVVIAEVDADQHRELGSRFGVTGFPTMKYFPKGSTEANDYNGGRNPEDFIKFMNEKAGVHARIVAAPSDVTVLNDDNFDQVVMDVSKDVLVEFYAPWCGHCKSLAPVYEKVGTDFKNDKHVVIAKMDADQYKVAPGRYGVSGFPTLKWFPRNNKEGEDYNGGRNEEDFIKFINEKSNTQRVAGGRLNENAGRVAELDVLAQDFSDASKQASLLADAKAFVAANPSNTDAVLYVKIMQKIAEKSDYASSEASRIERLLASGNVKADKIDDFTKRKNVLEQF